MKIIFLDIDGVLNHKGTPLLHQPCIDQLKRIVDSTGAKVVLSSSWREMFIFKDEFTPDVNSVRMIDYLMHKCGIEFIGYTPFDEMDRRELEIKQWIKDNNAIVDNFIIIDDLEYNFEDEFPYKFIKTAGYFGEGLTESHADEAIRRLNNTEC